MYIYRIFIHTCMHAHRYKIIKSTHTRTHLHQYRYLDTSSIYLIMHNSYIYTQTNVHTHIYISICIYTYHAHGAWFAVACKALFCSFLPAQLVRLEALCRAAAKTPYICRFCLNSQPTAFCLLIFGLTFRNCFCAKLSPAAAEIGRVRCAKACPFGCKFT